MTDGRAIDGTSRIGAGFDDGRGHAVAYFGYRNVKPVLQGDRDIQACVLQNTAAGVPRCGGSATANPGNALIFTGRRRPSTVRGAWARERSPSAHRTSSTSRR